MNRTAIERVKNPDNKTPGFSWNPVTGCLGPRGDGVRCSYCYAHKLANGRLAERYLANENIAEDKDWSMCNKSDPFYPRFWEERLLAPIQHKKPCGIFTVDMGELFGSWIPEEWQEAIFRVIRECPQHRFYLLTKQPQNLIKFSPFPENCFVGVTATNQTMHNEAIVCLSAIKAKVKYISYEPLLEYIVPQYAYNLEEIQWVVIGSQTKPTVLPKLEWVQEIEEAAREAHIPIFEKNSLSLLLKQPLIQEMPR